MSKKIKIGEVGVDSGQVMVCDPCYIRSEWKPTDFKGGDDITPNGEFSYDGACRATLQDIPGGQLNYKLGHAGAGVACRSGWGDGVYPVFIEINDDGRVARLTVEFMEEKE